MVGPYLQTAIDGFLFNYSSVLVLLIIIVAFVNFRLKRGNLFSVGFLQITCIGLLAQLHNVNAAYIYMFNPILIVWFMYLLDQYRENFPRVLLALKNTFIALVASSLILGFSLEFKQSYSFKTPILAGMKDYSFKNTNLIDEKFKLLDERVGLKQLFFDCPYGLFSVSKNGLYSADKWTWNEIPEQWVNESLSTASPGQFLLHCGGGPNEAQRYLNWVNSGKIREVKSLSNFYLYRFE